MSEHYFVPKLKYNFYPVIASLCGYDWYAAAYTDTVLVEPVVLQVQNFVPTYEIDENEYFGYLASKAFILDAATSPLASRDWNAKWYTNDILLLTLLRTKVGGSVPTYGITPISLTGYQPDGLISLEHTVINLASRDWDATLPVELTFVDDIYMYVHEAVHGGGAVHPNFDGYFIKRFYSLEPITNKLTGYGWDATARTEPLFTTPIYMYVHEYVSTYNPWYSEHDGHFILSVSSAEPIIKNLASYEWDATTRCTEPLLLEPFYTMLRVPKAYIGHVAAEIFGLEPAEKNLASYGWDATTRTEPLLTRSIYINVGGGVPGFEIIPVSHAAYAVEQVFGLEPVIKNLASYDWNAIPRTEPLLLEPILFFAHIPKRLLGYIPADIFGLEPIIKNIASGNWDAKTVLEPALTRSILLYAGNFMPGFEIIPLSFNGYETSPVFSDFYNKLYITPLLINAGTVMGAQSYNVEVWNASLKNSRLLNGTSLEGAEGIFFEGPLSYPHELPPMKAEQYRVNITPSGPEEIDSRIVLNFDTFSVLIKVVGKRLVVFYWEPLRNITEKLEWLTDIIETFSDEQRIALRLAPRRKITYSYIKEPLAGSAMELFARRQIVKRIGIPIWFEAERVPSIQSGATTINFDTENASYTNTVFIWENDNKYEALGIANLREDGIDLEQPVGKNYNNALVTPLLTGIVQDGLHMKKAAGATYASAEFIIIDDKNIADDFEPKEQGDGYVILTDADFIIEDFNERIYQAIEFIDNGQSIIEIEPNRELIEKTSIANKVTKSKEELWQWRAFLHKMRGRQGAFWIPSYRNEIQLVDKIEAKSVIAKIKPIGLSSYGKFPISTLITANNAAHEYNVYVKILDARPSPNGEYEEITLSRAIYPDVPWSERDLYPENVVRWNILDLVRLDTDQVTIQHEGKNAKSSVPIRTVV